VLRLKSWREYARLSLSHSLSLSLGRRCCVSICEFFNAPSILVAGTSSQFTNCSQLRDQLRFLSLSFSRAATVKIDGGSKRRVSISPSSASYNFPPSSKIHRGLDAGRKREREGGGEKPPRHRKLIHATKVGHCAFAREYLPITFTNYAIAIAYRLLSCPKHCVILSRTWPTN